MRIEAWLRGSAIFVTAFLAATWAGCQSGGGGGGGGDGGGNDNTTNDNSPAVNDNAQDQNDNVPINQPPVADAGADLAVVGGAVVVLDGSNSSDPEGDPLSFSWDQTAGDEVTLTDADSSSPSFSVPNATTTLSFELTVDDGDGQSDTDSVTVTVTSLSALFVVNETTDEITVYADPASLDGEVPPSLEFAAGAETSLFQPRAMLLTSAETLFVTRQNGGLVGYANALSATGAGPADQVVEGPETLLELPISLAYDAANDALYVGNAEAEEGVLVFDGVSNEGSFSGEVPPTRSFAPRDRSPASTTPMTIDSLAFDASGNLLVADTSGTNFNTSRILIYYNPREADGEVDADQEFGSFTWMGIEDMTVRGDLLFIVDGEDEVVMLTLTPELTDNVDPTGTLVVPALRASLHGIVISADGTGYLADRENHAIYIYENISERSGELEPDRTLEGTDTQLFSPRRMVIFE